MTKTVVQVLWGITDLKIRNMAFANLRNPKVYKGLLTTKQRELRKVKSFRTAIDCMATWMLTPQNHDFWLDVANKNEEFYQEKRL